MSLSQSSIVAVKLLMRLPVSLGTNEYTVCAPSSETKAMVYISAAWSSVGDVVPRVLRLARARGTLSNVTVPLGRTYVAVPWKCRLIGKIAWRCTSSEAVAVYDCSRGLGSIDVLSVSFAVTCAMSAAKTNQLSDCIEELGL